MQSEELIYQMTRTVYQKLGTYADPKLVESLVVDLYNILKQTNEGEAQKPYSKSHSILSSQLTSNRVVISVFGPDKPGIIASITQVLADFQCSVTDINQTVISEKFAMILTADIKQNSLIELQKRIREESERLGVKAYVQREDLFHSMHRV